MKLMNWSKISNMLAPEFKQTYANYLLVLGKKDDSSAQIRSNYKYLKSTLTEAVEVKNGNASYLLIAPQSSQVSQAETLVAKIKDEEFLDENLFKSEQSIDNLHHHKSSITCGLCNKPLSHERGQLSTLGPVCENKVQDIINDETPEPENFTSIYSESVDKGELVYLKINNHVQFVEIVGQSKDSLVFIDRKSLELELNKTTEFTKALNNNLSEVKKDDIQGVARLIAKKTDDKLFDDLMEIFK